MPYNVRQELFHFSVTIDSLSDSTSSHAYAN